MYDDARAGDLSDAEYVETIGVMATVIAIDTFCDAMGIPRHALPAPVAGEPRRRRPAGAREGLAWVPTVAPEDVTEAETGMYDGLAAVNIHRALSLVPAEVEGFFDLDAVQYLPDAVLRDFGTEYRSLTHAQIEFLAGRVSAINQCFYWTTSRAVLLRGSGEHTGHDHDLTAIVSFTHECIDADELVAQLGARNIVIGSSSPSSTRLDFESRGLPALCRAAVHYLNTEEEVARLAASVAAL